MRTVRPPHPATRAVTTQTGKRAAKASKSFEDMASELSSRNHFLLEAERVRILSDRERLDVFGDSAAGILLRTIEAIPPPPV